MQRVPSVAFLADLVGNCFSSVSLTISPLIAYGHCRIKIVGNYENHQCQIELSGVRLRDGGNWSCEMEEYVWGSIRGTSDKTVVSLTVVQQEEKEEGEDYEAEQGWKTWRQLRRAARNLRQRAGVKRQTKFRGWRNELDSIFVKSHTPIFLN